MDEIKAILLDFDGNLYNNVSAMKAATEDALKRYEVDYDATVALAETTRLIEKIQTSALSKIILNAWELLKDVGYLEGRKFLEKAEIVFFAYTLYKEYTKESTLFEGVPELLKVAKNSYKIAIVTSGSRIDTVELLKQFEIFQYVDVIISADDVTQTKPHPEGLEKALEALGIKPNQAIYVGDLVLDIKAGKNAGVRTIAVATGLVPKTDLEAEMPFKTIRHVTELSNVIPKLPQLKIDINADLNKGIQERREITPISQEAKVSFSERLKSITIEDVKTLLKHPFEFIRDKLDSYLKELGTTNLQDALTVFEEVEEDLLRVLGLVAIHALNERLDEILFKMFQAKYGAYLGSLNYEFIEQTAKTVFPDAFYNELRIALLTITKNILPENVYNRLLSMDAYDFISYILDGVKIGMTNLGMQPFDIQEFIGDKVGEDEMGIIEFIWEMVRTMFSVVLNILAIPIKLTLKQSTPILKDALQVTLESIARIIDSVDTNIFKKSEKFGKLGEILQKLTASNVPEEPKDQEE